MLIVWWFYSIICKIYTYVNSFDCYIFFCWLIPIKAWGLHFQEMKLERNPGIYLNLFSLVWFVIYNLFISVPGPVTKCHAFHYLNQNILLFFIILLMLYVRLWFSSSIDVICCFCDIYDLLEKWKVENVSILFVLSSWLKIKMVMFIWVVIWMS